MILDSAKKGVEERTQTEARRNENNPSDMTYTMRLLLPAVPPTLHQPSLPTINCDCSNAARIIRPVFLHMACACSSEFYIYTSVSPVENDGSVQNK